MPEDSINNRDIPNRLIIYNLELKKNDDSGKVLKIYPGGREILVNMTINESIFSPGVRGILKIKEPASIGGKDFNINGNETISISVENSGIPNSKHDLEFCVYDVKQISNLAQHSIRLGGGKNTGWEIRFISCENQYLDYIDWDNKAEFMNEDFMGKIASDEEEDSVGLVNILATKYFNPGATTFSKAKKIMEIDGTVNTIWLKSNQNLYPWGKNTKPPTLIQLMTNLAENAISSENPNSSNFLFWSDIEGWKFKSLDNLIAESNVPKSNEIVTPEENNRVYFIGEGLSPSNWIEGRGDPRVQIFFVSKEHDHFKMWKDGMYSSYYYKIESDFSDPYFEYLEFESKHEEKIIDFDYHRDNENWNKIETYKILPDNIDTSINLEEPNRAREVFDENAIYGYFSPPYNINNSNGYDYLSSIVNDEKFGRKEEMLWQTMFDQTELKMDTARLIQKNIKEPTIKNYKNFIETKNLKEKWNVYRHTICCNKIVDKLQFLAVIDDARLIQSNDRGGIYEYSWREVEMWPRDYIGGFTGDVAPETITPEDAPVAVVVVPNGLSGIALDPSEGGENAAFNINELMNTQEGDDVFVGPGINVADDDYNDYPEAYQMMPVGGYFKVGEDPCTIEDGADVYYHKHIVQMYSIPYYMLEKIIPNDNDNPPENQNWLHTQPESIYFFDVLNAHDGLCDCL